MLPDKQGDNFWEDVKLPVILGNETIQLYHIPQNGVGMPKDKTCPYVITLHDIIPLKMPETVSDRYLRIFNDELPKSIKFCDGIITVSNYSKRDISEAFNFPMDKIYVTYLASDPLYSPINAEYSSIFIKNKYHINKGFVLYVGGFSPRKNILGLIEAYSLLPQAIISKKSLIIAGTKGKSYDLYNARVKQLHLDNHVFFPGFICMEDMPHLYRAADLLVYPSFYEGFGLPPIEAMACGTPVVAASSTSMPEVLGDACLLTDPYDASALKDSILSVLTDLELRNFLIEKGFEKSRSFSWSNTASETIKIYENILKSI
jgi:glycosyltransferase involved in cell wall biosynthesis